MKGSYGILLPEILWQRDYQWLNTTIHTKRNHTTGREKNITCSKHVTSTLENRNPTIPKEGFSYH